MSKYKEGEEISVSNGTHKFSIRGNFLTVSALDSTKETKLEIDKVKSTGTKTCNAEVMNTIGEYKDGRLILHLMNEFRNTGKSIKIDPKNHTYEEIDTPEHFL